MIKSAYIMILCVLLFMPSIAQADVAASQGGLLQWHSTNIQLLRGHDYKVGNKRRTIVTGEHANSWKYGDNFGFIDVVFPESSKTSYYGEFSPRFSFSKMTGRDLSYNVSKGFGIKDLLISTTFEKSYHQGPQYLYGGAIDLKIPGFTFFNINAYVHDSTELKGQTWQSTIAWKKPFNIYDLKFVTEGFADFQGREGTSQANELIVPRLLLDVGDIVSQKSDKFLIGVEYQYWHNKFGIKGVTEQVPQLQAKWMF